MLGNSGSRAANGARRSAPLAALARSISSVENDGYRRQPARRSSCAGRAHSRAFKPEEMSRVFNLSVTENRVVGDVGARAMGPGGTVPDGRGRTLSLSALATLLSRARFSLI